MKECGKCRVTKEASDFAKATRAKDKLQAWCRSCLNTYSKEMAEYRKINGPTKIRESKTCKTCSLEKPINQFHRKTGHSADGFGSYCKPCWAINAKYWAYKKRKSNG